MSSIEQKLYLEQAIANQKSRQEAAEKTATTDKTADKTLTGAAKDVADKTLTATNSPWAEVDMEHMIQVAAEAKFLGLRAKYAAPIQSWMDRHQQVIIDRIVANKFTYRRTSDDSAVFTFEFEVVNNGKIFFATYFNRMTDADSAKFLRRTIATTSFDEESETINIDYSRGIVLMFEEFATYRATKSFEGMLRDDGNIAAYRD